MWRGGRRAGDGRGATLRWLETVPLRRPSDNILLMLPVLTPASCESLNSNDPLDQLFCERSSA